jgi:hypothetical protein
LFVDYLATLTPHASIIGALAGAAVVVLLGMVLRRSKQG